VGSCTRQQNGRLIAFVVPQLTNHIGFSTGYHAGSPPGDSIEWSGSDINDRKSFHDISGDQTNRLCVHFLPSFSFEGKQSVASPPSEVRSSRISFRDLWRGVEFIKSEPKQVLETSP
jgi:hypothetical protein